MEAVQAFLKAAKLTNKANVSAIKKSTGRNLQKFASVHELKQFLLESYSEIRKCRVVPVLCKNNHSLIKQMQVLYEHFPESPWVSHFMVYSGASALARQRSSIAKEIW